MARQRRHALLVAAALGYAVGCVRDGTFECMDDAQCESGSGPGVCEATGFCSFPDDACPSQRRYGDHAGALSGECVDESTGATSGSDDDGGPGDDDDPSDPTAPGMTTSDGVGTWWHCDWPTRRALRIVLPDGAASQEDVPVLVVLDASRIEYGTTAPNGVDLRFIADDDTTALHHEIESWNASGVSYAWIRVPQLHAGEQTVWMYYGNPSASALSNVDVWSEQHRGVWHLHTGAGDASGQAHDGTEQGVVVAGGWAGNGRAVQTSGQLVIVPAQAGLDGVFATGGTVSAWIRPRGDLFGQGRVVGKAASENGDGGWTLEYDFERQSVTFIRGFTSNRGTWRATDGLAPAHTWSWVAVTFDDSAVDPVPSIYVNGVAASANEQGMHGGTPDPDAGAPLTFGAEGGSFLGTLDEIRLESSVRSAEWIALQHRALVDDLVTYGGVVRANCD